MVGLTRFCMMSIKFFKTVTLVIGLTVLYTETIGCSCGTLANTRIAYEQSAAVYAGIVLNIEETRISDKEIYSWVNILGFNILERKLQPYWTLKKVTFLVSKSYKSQLKDTLEVFTHRSRGECGFEFIKGEQYVVYANEFLVKGRILGLKNDVIIKDKLNVSRCSRTALFNSKEDFKLTNLKTKMTSK